MQNPLPSGINKKVIKIPLPYPEYAGTSAEEIPFTGVMIVFNYDGKSWARQEYEKDHKGMQSLGRVDQS